MKKIFYLAIACALFTVCNAQESTSTQNSKDAPAGKLASFEKEDTFTFEKIEHDFGKISESNGDVECEFVFKNIGEVPLVVTNVTASCGCTAPDWSKEPVAPGEQGFIKVKFSPKGRSGNFSKLLAVYTNGSPARKSLKIKGSIEKQ